MFTSCSWLFYDSVMSCSSLVYDMFIIFSWLLHYLVMSCSLLILDFFKILFVNDLFVSKSQFVSDLFLTCSWLVNNLFMTCPLLVHDFFFFTISDFSATLQIPLNYLTYTTFLDFDLLPLHNFILTTLLYSHYITLFTSLEVLHFSHWGNFKFTKSYQLNSLALLSLAQLSPSLFTLIFNFSQFSPCSSWS